MSDARYDIIITGKLLEGTSPEQAIQRVAQLFKTPAAQAAKLVDGKPHRIKKAIPEDSARKFKGALTQAGLQTVAKKVESAESNAQRPSPPQTHSSLNLAPEGTPVLREDEREEVIPPVLDLSAFSLDEMVAWESDQAEAPPVNSPDYGLAPAGADIETLPDTREKLNPDISALSMDEPGVTLGKPKEEAPPPPDTSHIKLEKHNPFL